MSKTFDFWTQGRQYQLIGEIMALADALQCFPKVEWHATMLKLTLPPTAQAETIAAYANDFERMHCGRRNVQSANSERTDVLWSKELRERVQRRAKEDFCLMLMESGMQTAKFLSETFVTWYNRSEYLVNRNSKTKREFRQDLTLDKVIQEGQERKRRMQQRKLRDERTAQEIASGQRNEWDTVTHDVLPREVREMMDKERSGMEDFHRASNPLLVGRR